ncbi:MAG: hypothetical protein JO290_06355 [Sphingomonadaceae bacterium]|nr:hypothetical protein [Sphingomonadaceae bacterium]
MDRATFIALASGLFGERWQSPLADATGINSRSLRRMASGAQPVPQRLADALTASRRVIDLIGDLAAEYGAADEIRMQGDDGQLVDWTKAIVAASLRSGESVQ